MDEKSQKWLRNFLRQVMPEKEKADAAYPIPPGLTRYEAMLFVMRQAGHDVSKYPPHFPDDE